MRFRKRTNFRINLSLCEWHYRYWILCISHTRIQILSNCCLSLWPMLRRVLKISWLFLPSPSRDKWVFAPYCYHFPQRSCHPKIKYSSNVRFSRCASNFPFVAFFLELFQLCIATTCALQLFITFDTAVMACSEIQLVVGSSSTILNQDLTSPSHPQVMSPLLQLQISRQ